MSYSPLIAGALAGFVATAPMTAAMEAMHRRLPAAERYPLPPSEITEQIEAAAGARRRIDEPEHVAASLVTHFAVGTAAGGLYGPLAAGLRPNPLLGGVAFGLAVWATGYLGVLPALDLLRPATEHPPRRNALMITAHVVWGATLGVLLNRMIRPGRPVYQL